VTRVIQRPRCADVWFVTNFTRCVALAELVSDDVAELLRPSPEEDERAAAALTAILRVTATRPHRC
jgi:hypothetical protein